MQYPKVEHKLPELFDLIIQTDKNLQEIKSCDVIPFKEFKELNKQRNLCRIGAENFIIKQKGGTPNRGNH